MTKRQVLHVGCGRLTIDQMTPGFRDGGWEEVRFDIDPAMRPDIVGTISDMSAVPSASMDALYSSHNIEHVYAHEVPAMMREFRRVLKPTGFAAITCPDLQSLGEALTAGTVDQPLYVSSSGPITPLDVLYGFGREIGEGRTYMAHRTGFTRDTLARHLIAAGFPTCALTRRPVHFDLWAIAPASPLPREELDALAVRYGRR